MNVLDWVLLLVTFSYAVSGYWQGFVTGLSATLGLLAGGTLGVLAVPPLLDGFEPSVTVSISALGAVLLAASIGQGIGAFVGSRLRERITWKPVRSLDAVGGSALAVVAVLAVAWALGYAVSGSRLPAIGDQVRTSYLLGSIDRVMPGSAGSVLNAFNQVVDSNLFPRYLEPFADERIVEVDEPSAAVLRRPGVVAAEPSVVKVLGEAECDRLVEGSGFVYATGRVMTNAHVVAGVDAPTVEVDGETLDAVVVLYDSDLDVAVLALDDPDVPALQLDLSGESGDTAAVLGYPENGPYDTRPARIRVRQELRGPDIYGEGLVSRDVFSVRSLVRSGNSGGPLLSRSGDVLGVVFAASLSDPDTGYVLTAESVSASADAGVAAADDAAVDTGGCT